MMDEILTDSERKSLKSMARYWNEVAEREDKGPLYSEVLTVSKLLGPKLLFIVTKYLELTEGKE